MSVIKYAMSLSACSIHRYQQIHGKLIQTVKLNRARQPTWMVSERREREKNVTVMVQCVNGYKCAWGTERERGRTHKNTLNYSVFVYQTEITMRISFRIYSLRVFKALAVVRTKRSNIYQQHQDVRQTKFVCFASCRRFCLSSSNSQNSWMKPLENKLVAFVHKFY